MMLAAARLLRPFFARPTPLVARDLLGARIVRVLPTGERLVARVVETEAYHGLEDSASHARAGPDSRAWVMYGPPAHAYVYLIYGMYDMLNVSCDEDGFPAALLLRAVEPLSGIEAMNRLRSVARPRDLTNGPGKLCQALNIDRSLNGEDLTASQRLWFEAGDPLPDSAVATATRIGIGYADQEHRARLWRFLEKANPWVSKQP